MNTHKQPKMYVLVRKDLDQTYRCVQGGHAIAAYALSNYGDEFRKWANGTVVFLGVRGVDQLQLWGQRLTDKDKKWVGFHEPDIGDQMTAIACIDTGEVFRKLNIV